MTDEQITAFRQLRQLAAPFRYRVAADAEGYPIIPGRLGQIEWYHAENTHLAAYTAGRLDRLGRLLSLPGIIRHQVGDTEVRVLFPVERLAEVARVIQARIHRGQPSPASLEALVSHRYRPSSGGCQSTEAVSEGQS
jgi:hypothetical protein